MNNKIEVSSLMLFMENNEIKIANQSRSSSSVRKWS